MNDLPGYEFARENGYELNYHAGNKKSATYTKHIEDNNILHLTCHDNGTAELCKIIKMVVCKVENFSYPNKNFSIFEKQLSHIVSALPEIYGMRQ